MSNWLQLYGNLQKNLASSYIGSQQSVRIPNTVIFHRKRPILWFHTPSKSHGVQERKSNSGGIEVAHVFRTFIDEATTSIVATMIWYCEKSAMPSTFGDLKMKHLDEQELRSLLLHTVKGMVLPAYWVLQTFIGPGNDGRVSTVVSESLGTSKNFAAVVSKNRHSFGSFSKIHDACLTVESADTKHSRLEKISNKFMSEAVVDVSDIAYKCFAGSGVALGVGVTFFFRVDKYDLLWLLWCSIPQPTKERTGIPTNVTSQGNNLLSNGSIKLFLVYSTSFDTLRSAFSSLEGVIQVTVGSTQLQQPQTDQRNQYVQVIFDSTIIRYEKLIDLFWRTIAFSEDPESESGTSVLYYDDEQSRLIAESSAWREAQRRLSQGMSFLTHAVAIERAPSDVALTPFSYEQPESVVMKDDNNYGEDRFEGDETILNHEGNGEDAGVQYRYPDADIGTGGNRNDKIPGGKKPVMPVKRKDAGKKRESRSADRLRQLQKKADNQENGDEEDRFELDAEGNVKSRGKQALTVGDVSSRPKSAAFNNTRLALLCNPKGEYVKPIPSVNAAKLGPEKRLQYENNGPDGSSAEATEHALMRLRIEIKDLQLDIVESQRISQPAIKAKPPSSRVSSFPSSKSRSSQLSRNRCAKDAELVGAIPTIVDPVLTTKPALKVVPVEVRDHGAGSLPLEFGKKFGEIGRRKRHDAEELARKKGPPPPGQAEGLMDITGDIVSRVCTHLVALLSASSEAARRHRDLLLHEQQVRDAKAHNQIHLPKLNEENDEVHLGGGIVANTVSKVNQSHINTDGKPTVIPTGSGISRSTVQHAVSQTNMEFVYKPKTAPTAKPIKTAVKGHKTDGPDIEGEKEGESASERAFLGVIEQMSCVPNHRPVEELCTVLLWLLAAGGSRSEDDVSDANGSIKSVAAFDMGQVEDVLEAFAQYAKHARECLSEVTMINADRGPNNEKDSRIKWRSALSLRTWHCERNRVVPIDQIHSKVMSAQLDIYRERDRNDDTSGQSPGRSQSLAGFTPNESVKNRQGNGVESAGPGSQGRTLTAFDKLSSSSGVSGRSVSGRSVGGGGRSYVVGTQMALKVTPNLPVSSGTIRKLGKDEDKIGDKVLDKSSENLPPSQGHTMKVKVHIALDTFVAAAGLQAPIGRQKGQKKSSGIVFKQDGVEDTYQEVSKSLIPVVTNNLDVGCNSDIAYENDFDSPDRPGANRNLDLTLDQGRDHGRNRDRGRDEGRDEGQDEDSVQAPSVFSEFSHLTDHSDGYTANSKRNKGDLRKQYDADQRERIFHKLAPPLNTTQRFLVIISLLSDVARSIMLSISVLVKHTGAGHEITLRDLIVLFGSPCAMIIGKQSLNNMLMWLKANRRSDVNFKLANQTQTELALQKLFAFWPQLVLSVLPEESPLAGPHSIPKPLNVPHSSQNRYDDKENQGDQEIMRFDDQGNNEIVIESPRGSPKGRRNTTHLTDLDSDNRGHNSGYNRDIKYKKRSNSAGHVIENISLSSENKITDTGVENEDNEDSTNIGHSHEVKPTISMVPVICIVQLLWPDRHSTNKLFRGPDDFQPNVNFI